MQRLLYLFAAFIAAVALATGAPSLPASSSPPAAVTGPCPPPDFGNLAVLNLGAYISAPWYVQRQIPLNYQPVEEAYCVRAEYEPRDPKNISAGVVVNNYANRGGVNGPAVGTSKYDSPEIPRVVAVLSTFKAKGRDGKLLVGPEVLLKALPEAVWRAAFGPYWVVAVGYSQNISLRYEWAIISGGAPKIPSPTGGGCTTVTYKDSTSAAPAFTSPAAGGQFGPPVQGYDKGGLWFFTRKPVDTSSVARMEARAKALGLDTSQMIPVEHKGCLYLPKQNQQPVGN